MQTIDYLFVISLLFGGQLVTSTALYLVQRCIEMRFGLHMREVTLYWLSRNFWPGNCDKITFTEVMFNRSAPAMLTHMCRGFSQENQRYALESQVRTMFYSIFVKCDTYSQCEFGIYFANSCWYFYIHMEICLISVICHVAKTLNWWWKTCYCITEILERNGGSKHRELAYLVNNVYRLIATVDAPHKGQIAPNLCLYHDVTMICIIR